MSIAECRMPEVMGSARIVLVKPGDVLIFGNVGPGVAFHSDLSVLAKLKEMLGLKAVLVFEEDIDMAAVFDGAGA